MQNENIHKLLAAAQNVNPGGDGNSWTCYCPVHENTPGVHNNSLSVMAGDDGRIVVNCHNGCDPKDVIYSFGLTWKDCFPKKSEPTSKITAVYDYVDDDGVLRFQVCRIEPGKNGAKKDFRQRQPDGQGGWTWKTKGLMKFPYRLRELAIAPREMPVFIVEGEKQVDYLRSLGLVATCNPGGAGKWLRSYAKYFDDRNVIVVPDNDPPNEQTGKIPGAAHARDVADSLIGIAKSVHVIQLPNAELKWGLDDWLQNGNTLDDLSELMKDAPEWGPESNLVTEIKAEQPEEEMGDPLKPLREVLNGIGIVYCAETESGEIEIFSSVIKKFTTIKDPGKMTYAKLVQAVGHTVLNKVRAIDGEKDKQYGMSEVRHAMAAVAGFGKRGVEKLGSGVWRVGDKTILVNGTHIAVYDGHRLERRETAVFEDNVFNIGNSEEWFEYEAVAQWVNRSDRDWVFSAITELTTILQQWQFKIANPEENPQICADILASLIVASVIQSFWVFRPMVFLLGESNCGKSTLMQLLCGEENNPNDKGLMGNLAIYSSNQSAAGIRQMAESSSRPVFIDEFENSRHRKDILELLRGASRGSRSIRGSSDQKAHVTKLAFMAWAASTESGLMKQVDQNRWIQIQMIPPDSANMGKLTLPPVDEVIALRNKLIAAAIVVGGESRTMVDFLMENRPRHIEHRICQIFAVPAAVHATMIGLPREDSIENFHRMLNIYDQGQVEKDQDTTLETILTSPIRVPGGEKSLLSLIQASVRPASDPHHAKVDVDEILATHGVRIVEKFPHKWVFMAHSVISRLLLRGSNLEGVKIDDLLLRIPGAIRKPQRLSGKPMRGVMIPFEACIPPEEPDLFTQT